MSAKIYLKSEVVMVTTDVARLLRDTCHFSRQRSLSDRHIARLSDEMDRGAFVAGTQITFGVYPDGRMAILNGNHTLEAVAKSGVPIALTFTYIPVKDEDDAGRIYAQYDIHRGRGWSDAYKAYGFNEEIPAYWASVIGSALGVIMARFESKEKNFAVSSVTKSRDVRAEMMRRYFKQAHAVMEIAGGVSARNLLLLRRAPVMAVALETVKFQPSAAFTFWHEMLMDDGLKKGDPRKALLNWLVAAQGQSQLRSLQSKACALAWNAGFKGQSLSQLRPSSMVDIYIEGTPWTKAKYNPMRDITSMPRFEHAIPSLAVDKPSFVSGKMGVDPVVYFQA